MQDFKVRTLKVNSQYLDATGNVLAFNSQSVLLSGQAYPMSGNPNGYITTGQTGAFGTAVNTGSLTGVFYPLNSNPSGYANTGSYVDILGTGSVTIVTGVGVLYISGNSSTVNTGSLTGAFYPLSTNPSGYASSGNYLDVVGAGSITVITGSGAIYISGYTSGTFYINSGFATNPPWSSLTWGNPLVWTTTGGMIEDRKMIGLTGSTTLSITGLFNGWNGVLKVKQIGSGFTLGMPSGTKVINNASGIVSLTTGISGAIDVLGFAYDGVDLMVGVGNNFN